MAKKVLKYGEPLSYQLCEPIHPWRFLHLLKDNNQSTGEKTMEYFDDVTESDVPEIMDDDYYSLNLVSDFEMYSESSDDYEDTVMRMVKGAM